MKYVIKEGTYKRSKFIFIFTGVFLIGLFGYQLYDQLLVDEFDNDFPGDWDKVLGISIGTFLIFRSSVFTIRARDLFIEITDDQVKYRLKRSDSIKKVQRSNIDKLEVKKGKVVLITKKSERITIADFNEIRIRDDRRDSIITSIKQYFN